MDKVQKIREEVEKRYEYWKEKESNSHSIESEIRMSECQHLLLILDSLQEEPVSEELEEAAKRYATEGDEISGLYIIDEEVEAFKAGAKWQKEKEYTCYEEAFEDGAKWKNEQMMAKAVEMVVGYWMPNGLMLTVDETENCYNIDEGDKVKVIVIKED